MTISSMWLVQLHPKLEHAHYVEVPRCDDVIDSITSARCEEVRSKRMRIAD